MLSPELPNQLPAGGPGAWKGPDCQPGCGPPSGWYDALVLGQSSGPTPAAHAQVRDTSPGSQLSVLG